MLLMMRDERGDVTCDSVLTTNWVRECEAPAN